MSILCVLVAAAAGCNGVMTSFFNGFLSPSEVGSYGPFGREGTLDVRSSLSLQDAPTGVMGVADPQPEDLVPVVEEYQYALGDVLNVRIYELLQRGTETAVQVTVDETGSISLPVIGRLEVAGLTLPEIEAEIVDQVVRRNILLDPQVLVEPAVRRKLSYTVYGTIPQPNLYPLGQYNLRLLDAINLAGGLVDAVTEIYVVRNPKLPEPVLVSNAGVSERLAARPTPGPVALTDGYATGSGTAPAARARLPEEPPQAAPPPTTEAAREEIVELMSGPASGRTPSIPGEASPENPSPPQWIHKNGQWVEDSAPVQPPRDEWIETMIREPQASAPTATSPEEPVPPTPSQPRWIYYNGKWIETEAPTSTPAPVVPPRPAETLERPTQPSIDWAQVAGLSEQRVIKISADALREGDPRHNIVVRPGDAIRLASGDFGEYYVMGQVTRPGAYSLTGRSVTLKMAIAAAGNLAPLAWPQHGTVYRRLGDREQMIQVNLDAIFAGKAQDFFLKKDDLILVGTHPVTPFLAVLRNAFRMSYGFGFVYDRNFADIDSYGVQPNPALQPQRYPNLFR